MHKAARPDLGDSSASPGQVQAMREPTLTKNLTRRSHSRNRRFWKTSGVRNSWDTQGSYTARDHTQSLWVLCGWAQGQPGGDGMQGYRSPI